MIFAFVGRKRGGKSTAALYVKEKRPLAVRLNFKDALLIEVKERFPDLIREIIAVYDKIDYDGMKPWTIERLIEEKPRLFRTLLQNYATDVRRGDNMDYWVTKWLKQASKIVEQGGDIIVDDLRFPNELDVIRQLGGTVIKIERTDMEVPATEASTDGHSSESYVDLLKADHVIAVATGEFEKLHSALDEILDTAPEEIKTYGD